METVAADLAARGCVDLTAILTPSLAAGGHGDALRSAGIRVITCAAEPAGRLTPASVAAAGRAVRSARADVVHFNLGSPRAAQNAMVAAALLRTPRRVATFHLVPALPPASGARGALKSIARRSRWALVHEAIAVSHGSAATLVEDHDFPGSRLRVVLNGVEDRILVHRPARAVDPARPVVGALGRLEPQKDLGSLIDAMPTVWKRHPTALLRLAGDGTERDRLERRARDVDAAGGRIEFAGATRDPLGFLARCDVLAMPSLYEGLPFVLLEAMAVGTPAVASRIPGVTDLADDDTARLVPPRSPAQLGEAISSLLASPERAAGMADRARRRVQERFTQRAMVDGVARLYRVNDTA